MRAAAGGEEARGGDGPAALRGEALAARLVEHWLCFLDPLGSKSELLFGCFSPVQQPGQKVRQLAGKEITGFWLIGTFHQTIRPFACDLDNSWQRGK